MDDEAPVQWVFVSRGLKARLLRHAIATQASPEAIFRASLVLQQPRSSSPHDDHFHIRIYCDAVEGALSCRDRGPRWPWHRRSLNEREGLAADVARADDLSDSVLLSELMSPLQGDALAERPAPERPAP